MEGKCIEVIVIQYSRKATSSEVLGLDPSSIPESGRSPGKGIGYPLQYSWAFLVAQMVKNSAMWEIWVQSLGWGDPLEDSMATHSSILA